MSLEVISLHIPKTGGRSLLTLMKEVYGEQSVLLKKRTFFTQEKQQLKKVLLQELRKDIKVIHGHFHYEEVDFLRELYPDAKWITFFRDAVSRVISNHHFFQHRLQTQEFKPEFKARLGESVLEYAGKPETQNKMSKHVARMALEDFDFIGTLEHFETDMKNLIHQMNWPVVHIPFENKNSNLASRYTTYSKEELDQVRKLNQADHDLYKEVLKLKNYEN